MIVVIDTVAMEVVHLRCRDEKDVHRLYILFSEPKVYMIHNVFTENTRYGVTYTLQSVRHDAGTFSHAGFIRWVDFTGGHKFICFFYLVDSSLLK